jgi:ubiquinol-cytochrome c reductase iron-sulfur subunit
MSGGDRETGRPAERSSPEYPTGRRAEDLSVRADQRSERLVATCFGLSSLATIAFLVVFWAVPKTDAGYTPLLGICLAVALFGVGVGAILWAKKLMPDEEAVQERHPMPSDSADAAKTAETFNRGTEQTGFARRRLLRYSFLGAMGTLALPIVPIISDLGEHPRGNARQLKTTPWKKGSKIVTSDGSPVRIGDLEYGGLLSIFPEGHEKDSLAPSLLIRLRTGENVPKQGRENWEVDGYVAYSAVCTHAGCPAKLYEQQTHHLLCPCHQSTFLVTEHCKPIFGPAARPLPQLPLALDADGYFVAADGYQEPVGPSFWERA